MPGGASHVLLMVGRNTSPPCAESAEEALKKISRVKAFCSNAKLTGELVDRMMGHLEYVFLVRKLDLSRLSILQELSDPLKAEVALQRCKPFLLNSKFRETMGMDAVSGKDKPLFIKQLVSHMQCTHNSTWLHLTFLHLTSWL